MDIVHRDQQQKNSSPFSCFGGGYEDVWFVFFKPDYPRTYGVIFVYVFSKITKDMRQSSLVLLALHAGNGW